MTIPMFPELAALPAVFLLLANLPDPDTLRIQGKPIGLYLQLADLSKHRDQGFGRSISESKKVHITGRAVHRRLPDEERKRALEHKLTGVTGPAHSVEKALAGIAHEQ